MTRLIPRFVPLAAVLMLAPTLAPAQTLSCDNDVSPFSSYTVQIGTQMGPDVALNARLFSGPRHNGIISKGADTESYLVITGLPGEGELVIGTNETQACATPGMKPKFYSTDNRAGRIRLIPDMPLRASIKACPHRWLAPKCSRTITIGGISYTANKDAPLCTGIGECP